MKKVKADLKMIELVDLDSDMKKKFTDELINSFRFLGSNTRSSKKKKSSAVKKRK